jgi:hypothetical protein
LTTTIGSVTTNLLIPPRKNKMKLARELTGRREHESLAVQFKASFNASKRTFIRMMTRIMQIVIANPLPTAPKAGKFGIILYNAGLG